MEARKLAPILVVCLLSGCAYQPIRVTESLTAPPDLIRPVCFRWEYGELPRDAHFNGHASLIWSADMSRVVAVECDLTSLSQDFSTVFTRVDIRDDEARNLREFLSANGIDVNWAP